MATTQAQQKINGLNLDVLQDTVTAVKQDPGLARCRFRARNRWMDGAQNCTKVSDFYGNRQEMQHQQTFEMHADEPPMLAGYDRAPNPVEHLLHALASCVTTSLVAHAAVRGIHIDEVESELEGDIDLRGFLGLDSNIPKGFTEIRIRFRVKADDTSMDQLKKLTEFSPVLNTLTKGTRIDLRIDSK